MCTPQDYFETETFVAAAMQPGFIYFYALDARQPWSAVFVVLVLAHLARSIVDWRRASPETPPGSVVRTVVLGLGFGVSASVLIKALA